MGDVWLSQTCHILQLRQVTEGEVEVWVVLGLLGYAQLRGHLRGLTGLTAHIVTAPPNDK